MNELARDVRLSIYRHFVDAAAAPDTAWLAAECGASPPEVAAALDELAELHAIALEPGGHRIRMAHPFSARAVGYAVESRGHTYQTNCAWDALALPALLGAECTARARCPDCGEPLSWRASADRLLEADADTLHFAVPARRFWDDIGFT